MKIQTYTQPIQNPQSNSKLGKRIDNFFDFLKLLDEARQKLEEIAQAKLKEEKKRPENT